MGRQPSSGPGTMRPFWGPQTGLYPNRFGITGNAPLSLQNTARGSPHPLALQECPRCGGGAASTGSTYGILDRCRVAEGGKMFWKFLEPGFLKRCSGELP